MARYKVLIKASAAKEIEAVDQKKDRQHIVSEILSLAEDPRPPGHEKLAGREDQYRVRSGRYRIIYSIGDARVSRSWLSESGTAGKSIGRPPNTALHRTPAAAPPSPVSFQTLGDESTEEHMALRVSHLAIAKAIGVAVGLIAGPVVFAQTIHPWGTSRCPPPGNTSSLLQASDAAYAKAPSFAMLLQARHFIVHCVTRTTLQGTLGVQSAAGFQTNKGPISVLFFDGAEQLRVFERKTPKGYRYRFQHAPHPGIGDVLDVDGPMYFVIRGCWLVVASDADVAATLSDAGQESHNP